MFRSQICSFITVLFFFISGLNAQETQSLFFNEQEYDFGIIQEDSGSVRYSFIFINETDKSIRLKDVKVTCGCTSPFWNKESISSSEQGKVDVAYNPKGRPGGFSKTITVITESDEVYQLKIKGYVEPKPGNLKDDYPYELGGLLWSTRALNFGKVKINLENHDVSKKPQRIELIKVYNPTDSAISVIVNAPTHLQVSEDSFYLNAKENIRLKVKFLSDSSESLELGYRSDNILFDLAENKERVTINTFASIEEYFPPLSPEERRSAPKLGLNERNIDFEDIKKEEIKEVRFIVTNNGNSPLNIRSLKSNCNCLKASLEESLIQPKDSADLIVRFFPGQREGIQHKSVTIFSNDPINPAQLVTIRATVK